MMPDICIHHHPCADGFASAWAIWKRWPQTVFVPGVYGQPPPDVTDKDILIVDFSFKRPVLEAMVGEAASVTILDHHKTAEADLAPLLADGSIQGLFDMTKSGAVLAWEYAHPGDPVPRLLQHVQDRDLWQFKLPGTREIQAAVFSEPYDFARWDWLVATCETDAGRDRLIHEGEAIERKHFKDVNELLALCTREMTIGGHRVPVANLPYTLSSDGAGKLAEGHPFGACYYDNAEGQRVFSLRARDGGIDVSAIAASYGGGGHAKASGFSAPLGWEGDV